MDRRRAPEGREGPARDGVSRGARCRARFRRIACTAPGTCTSTSRTRTRTRASRASSSSSRTRGCASCRRTAWRSRRAARSTCTRRAARSSCASSSCGRRASARCCSRSRSSRKRLAADGLFDAARKRPLPAYPRTIGLVTSPTGAAIRDLLHVLRGAGRGCASCSRRSPSRARARRRRSPPRSSASNRLGGVDVLIVGRGGGSLEDLWAFNEEVVVRAIAASAIPVVSAVGHESDIDARRLRRRRARRHAERRRRAGHDARPRAGAPRRARPVRARRGACLLGSIEDGRDRLARCAARTASAGRRT